MGTTIACSRATESRKANRYHLKKPALFSWVPQVGPPKSGSGVTRDINKSGVYVLTDELPQVGALVQLDILIPQLLNAYLGMHLIGDGVVVRIESGAATQGGFAASVHFYAEGAETAPDSLYEVSTG